MGYPRPISTDDLDVLEAYYQSRARESFWAFRQYMRPTLIKGWFHKELAYALQQFAYDLLTGTAPVLLVQAPPQHGKSLAIIDFLAWLAGLDPDRQTIYTSFSERLGVRANLMLQRVMDSPKYAATFPKTRLAPRGVARDNEQHLRNREILEFVGRTGYFRNTTVRGSITGEGAGLGVIDDPIKGREEANSFLIREKTWDWMTDDLMTRFTKDAGILGIMTRWHVDDPFGRLMKMRPDAKVLRYPALAEVDEPNRRAGEPLFPELKSKEFLERQRVIRGSASWASLYQQNPIIAGGNLFKESWWNYADEPPNLAWRAIYVDTAQKTKETNDYTVFQCWGATSTGKQAVLLDQVRARLEAPELLERARAFWRKHAAMTGRGPLRKMLVEDKVSGTGLIQTLRRERIPVRPIERATDKVTRAMDASPLVESGGVVLLRGVPHLADFLLETSAFPNGDHDDMVDPMMDAVMDICSYGNRMATTW